MAYDVGAAEAHELDALHGGEDYQLLMAVPRDALDALRDVAVVWDVAITVIGAFSAGPPGVALRFGDALRRVRPASHDHFRAAAGKP